jgi:hypothetical protein
MSLPKRYITGLVVGLIFRVFSSALVIDSLTGRFDNIVQAKAALIANTPTAASGGHEHVTLETQRHFKHENILVAAYRFGYDPMRTFRFRYYEFIEPCYMKIYRPSSKALQQLVQYQYNTEIFFPEFNDMEYMTGCDIKWTTTSLPKEGYCGELVAKETIITSASDPTVKLKVVDSLFVTSEEIQINDKVYTLDGKQIIGNIYGIPYILCRVM